MATATSYTETKIQELIADWESIGLTQGEINSYVIQLKATLEENSAQLQNFYEVVRPQLEADLAAGSARISDLNDNVLPNLQAGLDQANLDVLNLVQVTIPSLQDGLESTITNVNDRPNVYVQDEPPTNPDEDDRYLVVGDSWFDSDDGNKQRVWNGVEWSTFNVDVADFSLTVRKFLSTKHAIY